MYSRKNKRSGLTPNMEDYLEAIAIVKQKHGVARVRDISHFLDVKPSSVNSALTNLTDKGFVIHESYGHIDLTRKGEKAAEDVIKRHGILLDFLTIVLGVDREVAGNDACLMEHSLSSETVDKLTKFMEFVNICPEREKPEWISRFQHYYSTGELISCRNRR